MGSVHKSRSVWSYCICRAGARGCLSPQIRSWEAVLMLGWLWHREHECSSHIKASGLPSKKPGNGAQNNSLITRIWLQTGTTSNTSVSVWLCVWPSCERVCVRVPALSVSPPNDTMRLQPQHEDIHSTHFWWTEICSTRKQTAHATENSPKGGRWKGQDCLCAEKYCHKYQSSDKVLFLFCYLVH